MTENTVTLPITERVMAEEVAANMRATGKSVVVKEEKLSTSLGTEVPVLVLHISGKRRGEGQIAKEMKERQ